MVKNIKDKNFYFRKLMFYLDINSYPDERFCDCWFYTNYRSTNKSENIKRYLIVEGFYIHRLSAFIFLDFDLDSKLEICHKCDNTFCYNPDHLFIGTHAENMKDMVNKNRQRRSDNEFNVNCKFDNQTVLEVKRLFDE